MGSIAVFCVQKGGSGKSFFARHLAVEAALRGYRVCIADADPQGTCRTWADIAAARSVLAPPVIPVTEEDLQERLLVLAAQADLVLVDMQGALNKRLSRALEVADLAILPVNPTRPEDIWALADTIAIVREAQLPEFRPDLPAFIAVSAKRNTKISAAAQKALAQQQFPVLRVSLKDFNDYNMATTLGLGITSYAPKSAAAVEFRQLADEFFSHLPNLKLALEKRNDVA